jgi:hypothetical protein
MSAQRLPSHAKVGLLVMASGAVVLAVTFPWERLWLLSVGTLVFWWGVVILLPDPLRKPGTFLMALGTVGIIASTVMSYR